MIDLSKFGYKYAAGRSDFNIHRIRHEIKKLPNESDSGACWYAGDEFILDKSKYNEI